MMESIPADSPPKYKVGDILKTPEGKLIRVHAVCSNAFTAVSMGINIMLPLAKVCQHHPHTPIANLLTKPVYLGQLSDYSSDDLYLVFESLTEKRETA